jgi:hypothetical protein
MDRHVNVAKILVSLLREQFLPIFMKRWSKQFDYYEKADFKYPKETHQKTRKHNNSTQLH